MRKWPLFALLPWMVAANSWAAAPTAGAYTTDPQNSWVQDRLAEVMNTPNTILCFMGKLRADAMVNQGNYVALVDMEACDSGNRGADTSSNTNTAANNVVNYTRVTVNSTRTSSTAPMKVKVWFNMSSGPSNTQVTMFAYGEVSESPSTTNPNGVFTMTYCGVPASQADPLAGSCTGMQGQLSVSGTTISFAEDNAWGETTRMTLDKSGANGSGHVRNVRNSQTKDGAFAYNATHFQRGSDANNKVCFARDEASADVSTWRYGVYKSDGSRLDLSNPSFPITASVSGQTYWGHAGFWGIFFPEGVLSNVSTVDRVSLGNSNAAPISYDLQKYKGKLYKMTRVDGTLADLKGQPIMLQLPAGALQISGAASQAGQFEVVWNGSALQAMRQQGNTPQNGSFSWTDLSSSSVLLTASTLRSVAAWQKSLQGFSQSAGGEVRIEVPSTGDFVTGTRIATRTREVVVPGSTDAPSQLACVNRCPKGDLTNADFDLAANGSPFQTIQVNNWGVGGTSTVDSSWAFQPVSLSPQDNLIRYIFPSSGTHKGLLVSGTSPVDASGLSLSAQFAHGLQSGRLIDLNSDYSALRCSSGAGYTQNNSGDSICPWMVENAPVYYTYETGPNPYNQYMSLSRNGTAVTFDPPITFSLTTSTSNTTLKTGNTLLGSVIQLQYNGFGELQGVPGTCINMSNNQPIACGQANNTNPVRWVPAFSIKDGTELVKAGTSYYVRYLDRELRFAKVADSDCSSLNTAYTTALNATLPSAPTLDARSNNGLSPTLTDAPKVVDGVVQ